MVGGKRDKDPEFRNTEECDGRGQGIGGGGKELTARQAGHRRAPYGAWQIGRSTKRMDFKNPIYPHLNHESPK